MNSWRNGLLIKPLVWLILCLLAINPALALQYPHLNQSTDFIGEIPDYLPKAYHIHISQKAEVLALLARQGYGVIPATHRDAEHLLDRNNFTRKLDIQLAANTDIELPPQDDCIPRDIDCPIECRDDNFYNNYGCPETCKPTNKETKCEGADCPEQQKPPRNDCTDTDPVERAKDRQPAPEPTVSKPATRGTGSVSIHRDFRLPNINMGGGGKGDAAAVMLIVIGVVVIAALFIYAGKWLVDMINNDEDYYAYWWDIGMQFISLDTEADEHGNFSGIKFSGGFVPNMHTHFGITAEVGQMDLDLRYNRNSAPQHINLQGAYWLIGPTVRWLFANTDTQENLAHNTYIYLELLGGRTDHREIEIIGVARIGVNTGLGEHLRVGLHYGAFYLGMDEAQGFANDGDNYWNMAGLEIGYQF